MFKDIKIFSKTEKVEDKQPEKKVDTRYIHRVKLTGVPVADMIQLAIKWHQDNLISLRSISLRPYLHDKYVEYLQREMDKRCKAEGKQMVEINKEMTFVAWDVDIKRGSSLQKDDMYGERYYIGQGQKDTYFGPIDINEIMKYHLRQKLMQPFGIA